jgi:hypothetical protein
VWYESGAGSPIKSTSYAGSALTHSLSGLTTGAIYRIFVRSKNIEGYSLWSEYLELAASPLPAAPAAASMLKLSDLSSKTSI